MVENQSYTHTHAHTHTYIYIYIYIYIAIMVKVFANGPVDWDSISGRVLRKTQKIIRDAFLFNTHRIISHGSRVSRGIQRKK